MWIFKLSCTILFSYVVICSYVMFHFATRTALTVKNGKLHSLCVHGVVTSELLILALGAYFFLPEMK